VAFFLVAMGWYAWQRRDVPGGKPFAAASLLASLVLLGIACEAAAVRPETKIAWYKFELVIQVFTATAGTCFSLEYVYPGRWLPRRNLSLLALPPALLLLLVIIDDAEWVWRSLQIQAHGSVLPYFTIPGAPHTCRISPDCLR
jgi:hypothetical protein